MCDLDSDISGSSKDTQRIEPKAKTELSSTVRPVCRENEEIEERTKFERDTLNHEKHDEVTDPISTGALLVVVDRPWNTRVLQLMELATAVQSVQAQLMVSEAARTNLQAQVERLGRTTGERKIGVDTRNLGSPSQWSVVFRSYAALVHPALKDEMQRVERLSTAETNAGRQSEIDFAWRMKAFEPRPRTEAYQ